MCNNSWHYADSNSKFKIENKRKIKNKNKIKSIVYDFNNKSLESLDTFDSSFYFRNQISTPDYSSL